MMRTAFMLVFMFTTLVCLDAQEKRRFIDFRYTDDRRNELLYGHIAYSVPLASNISTNGYGWNASVGLNLAYPFSKKITLGMFAGLKIMELFIFPGKFNSRFSLDYVNAVHPENSSGHDSLLIATIARKISFRSESGGLSGGQVGFYLHYPEPYLPMVTIYKAGCSDAIYAYQYDGVYGADYLYVSATYYGVSASWTLWKSESGARINLTSYFMRGKFASMNVEGLWMRDFVDPAFAEKYAHLWRAGLTAGLAFY